METTRNKGIDSPEYWANFGQPPIQEFMRSDPFNELVKALAQFQSEQGVIEFDQENTYQKYKYATLTALVEGTKDARKNAKLAVTQLLNSNSVTTVLMHESGQWISSQYVVTPTDMKGMSRAQEMGAAVTYARRYAYAAILGIVSDEDIDGMDKKDPKGEKKSTPDKKRPVADSKTKARKLDPGIKEDLDGAKNNEEMALIWESLTDAQQNDQLVTAEFKLKSIELNKEDKNAG